MKAQVSGIHLIVLDGYCMYERVQSEVHYLRAGTIFFFLQITFTSFNEWW